MSTYSHLYDNAKRVMCMFGSTYCCERLFSKMNYAKNKLRTRLSDRHLNEMLQISSTKLPVDFKTLAMTQKQHHTLFVKQIKTMRFNMCLTFNMKR